ncbi:MAG: PocR ligand-binding domain-containing protein [Deltaproteobacteria bacterium]|nr:PocR ligand-binding domain-containing protein [Deltaproteobacteria bacterium]
MNTHQMVNCEWLTQGSDDSSYGTTASSNYLSPPTLIDLSRLQDILESISKIGRLSMVAVDDQGHFLTKHTGVQGFCRQAELNPLTFRCCQRSREFGLSQALCRGERLSYFCPFGFLETIVPITCHDQSCGMVMLGQVRCNNAPVGLVDLSSTMTTEVTEALTDPILKAFHEAVPLRDFHELNELASMLERLGSWLFSSDPTAHKNGNSSKPENHSFLNGAATNLNGAATNEAWPKGFCSIGPSSTLNSADTVKKIAEPVSLPLSIFQNQIGPRLNTGFFINTVSSLANLAVLEGAWKTNRLAIMLADHLKSSEQRILKEFRSLNDELVDIERYLAIQDLRYGDLLSFKLNIPAELTNLAIPTDSLLAATERAVCFGISDGEEQLEVAISAQRQGRQIILEVSDNLTSAISPLEELLASRFQNGSEMLDIAYRLEFVRTRLERHFGKKAKIGLTAGPDGGSVYRIHCPLSNNNGL